MLTRVLLVLLLGCYVSDSLAFLGFGGGKEEPTQAIATVPDAAAQCFNKTKGLPDYMLYGKAAHEDAGQAQVLALQEISQQLSVEIDSTVSNVTAVANNTVQSNSSSSASLRSKANLAGAKLFCEHFDQASGKYYRVFVFDSRPPLLKLAERLIDAWGGKVTDIQWSGYTPLIKSTAVQELTQLVRDQNGQSRKNEHIDLDYHGGQWHITIGLVSQAIDEDTLISFLSFPPTSEFGFAQLSLKKLEKQKWVDETQLIEKDEFRFEVTVPENTYFQIFNIYADGRVAALDKVRKSTLSTAIIPTEGVLEAALLNADTTTIDIYLLVASEKKFNAPGIAELEAWKGMNEGKKAYQLDALLSWMANKPDLQLAAVQVVTLPR